MRSMSKLSDITIWKKWFLPIWSIIFSFIFVSISLSTETIRFWTFDGSEKGWGLLVSVYLVPLSLLGVGIPIYGIIVTLYRSTQFEDHLEETRKRSFESTFFDYLKLYQSIIDSLETGEGKSGKSCLKSLYEDFKSADYNEKTFEEFYNDALAHLSHYFSHLRRMIGFVHESSIKGVKKSDYIDTIKGVLSSHELLLIFYFGSSDLGEGFKKLIEEYSMLDRLPKHLLRNKNNDLNYYNESAYGDKSP